MAIGDISALAPIIVTPGTTVSTITVPSTEEWTLRFGRGVCLLTSGTAPTLSVGLSAACNELCFNEVIPIPSAGTLGAKNVIGPDFVTAPGGSTITYRASQANAVRLTITGTKKQVS